MDTEANQLSFIFSMKDGVAPEMAAENDLVCSQLADVFSLGWLLGHLGTYLKMRLISELGHACAVAAPQDRMSLQQLEYWLHKGKTMTYNC
jgi:hypothetical protein